jgi:ElaB/YqjD/DUF883 family membrane-anchored ribosome-binding protein
MDTNSDGYVTKEEAKEVRKKMKRKLKEIRKKRAAQMKDKRAKKED